MFTRTNIVVATVLFLLFFVVFLVFFSELGVFDSKDTQNEMAQLSSLVERKSAEVELLRHSKDEKMSNSDEELLISYQTDPVTPEVNDEAVSADNFKPLSYGEIIGFSIIPSVIYLFIVFLLSLRKRRKKDECVN